MSEMKTASPRMPSPLTAGITVLAFYLQIVSFCDIFDFDFSLAGVFNLGPGGTTGHEIMNKACSKCNL